MPPLPGHRIPGQGRGSDDYIIFPIMSLNECKDIVDGNHFRLKSCSHSGPPLPSPTVGGCLERRVSNEYQHVMFMLYVVSCTLCNDVMLSPLNVILCHVLTT